MLQSSTYESQKNMPNKKCSQDSLYRLISNINFKKIKIRHIGLGDTDGYEKTILILIYIYIYTMNIKCYNVKTIKIISILDFRLPASKFMRNKFIIFISYLVCSVCYRS